VFAWLDLGLQGACMDVVSVGGCGSSTGGTTVRGAVAVERAVYSVEGGARDLDVPPPHTVSACGAWLWPQLPVPVQLGGTVTRR